VGPGIVTCGGFESKEKNQIRFNSNDFKLLQTLSTPKMPFLSSKIFK
jgi:hypothetical protein